MTILYIDENDRALAKRLCARDEQPVRLSNFNPAIESSPDIVIVGSTNEDHTLFCGESPEAFASTFIDKIGSRALRAKKVKEIFLFGNNLDCGEHSIARKICRAFESFHMELIVHAFTTPKHNASEMGNITLEIIEQAELKPKRVKMYYLHKDPQEEPALEPIMDSDEILLALRLPFNTLDPKRHKPTLSYNVAKALRYLQSKLIEYAGKDLKKEDKEKQLHLLTEAINTLHKHSEDDIDGIISRLKGHRLRPSHSYFCMHIVEPLHTYLTSSRAEQQKLLPEESSSSDELALINSSTSPFSSNQNPFGQSEPVVLKKAPSKQQRLNQSMPELLFPHASDSGSSSKSTPLIATMSVFSPTPGKSSFTPLKRPANRPLPPIPEDHSTIPKIHLPDSSSVSEEEKKIDSEQGSRSRSQSLASNEPPPNSSHLFTTSSTEPIVS